MFLKAYSLFLFLRKTFDFLGVVDYARPDFAYRVSLKNNF